MIHHLFRILISVRAKLFFGFFAMAVLIMGLGGFGVFALGNAGDVVRTTFDRPLMAINYSRAAGQRFTELTRDLALNTATPEAVEDRMEDFRADLDVARERSISKRAVPYFDRVDTASAAWLETLSGGGDADLAASISGDLEIIVELQSGESFRAREAALAQVERLERWALASIALALLLTSMLSSWIAVTIVGPLRAASTAAQRISGGDFEVEIPAGRADETGALLDAMSSMRDNIRQRMAGEVRARDVAEERLAESLDSSKDAVVLANPGGRIVLANARTGEIFPELSGVSVRDHAVSALFDAHGRPLFGQYYMQDGHRIASVQGRWLRVNASRTREGGTLLIWTDITHDIHARQLLERTRDQALAADRAKTDFLASMSHELRTPLNAVIGFSDIIETEKLGPVGTTAYRDMAGHISRSGQHLLSIVKNVLHIASGESDAADIETGSVDLAQTLAFCLDTVQTDADAASVSLHQMGPKRGAIIHANTLHIEQICLNLLGNAVKFNREGGRVDATIDLPAPGRVRLVIRDTGIGIPADRLEHVRQPFSQAETGTRRSHDGVGLGLSIVDRLAARHGGSVAIQSTEGHGTSVAVDFPSLASARDVTAPRSAPLLSQAA